MKWCVEFPEETILVVRPSLDAICLDIKPAAKLLSELLYRCSIRKEHQQDAQNMNEVASEQGQEGTQDTTLRIYRTQAQLVENMIHEMTEKTLHKVAVPALLLLGYIDLEEYLTMNCYIVHVDRVREALLAYRKGDKQLEQCIRSYVQLEKFLIGIQLEKFPIDRKSFLSQLEKVLIAIRNSSNLKRGRKPRSEAGGEAQSEEPQISLEIDSKIVIEEEGTYGANAPTPADLSSEELHDKVDGAIIGVETVQRITDKHKAVQPNETSYHIAVDAIRNAEEGQPLAYIEQIDDETPTEKREAVKIGATHGNDTTVHPGTSMDLNHGEHHTEAHEQITSQHAPGQAVKLQAVAAGQAPSPLDAPVRQSTVLEHAPGAPPRPLAAGTADVLGRHGDAGSDQASRSLLLDSEPAQADFPPAGSTSTTTAQASGRRRTVPERPKGVKKPPVMPSEPPKVTLTEQEQAFWELWCNVWFNKDVLPDLNATAYGHVKKLAPHITTAEQMESLAKRARTDLEENTGVKRKTVHLGNCVNSYPGWKQEQQAEAPPDEKPPQDKYTAATRNEERNERGLQRLRDRIIARGEKPPC